MGPEPIMGAIAWLGILVCAVLLVGLIKKSTRLYVAIMAVPGVGLALVSVQGQVGVARTIGLSFMFFAAGSIVVGLPMAALLWFWLRYRIAKAGTLQ